MLISPNHDPIFAAQCKIMTLGSQIGSSVVVAIHPTAFSPPPSQLLDLYSE